MKYKKGEEIRLVANGDAERVRIQRLLKRAGFKAGRAFRKSAERTQICIPIYGREQVAGFVKMVEETEKCQPSAAPYALPRAVTLEYLSPPLDSLRTAEMPPEVPVSMSN